MSGSANRAPGVAVLPPQRLAAPQHLSDADLEAELTIEAATPGKRQYERFLALLNEHARRHGTAA